MTSTSSRSIGRLWVAAQFAIILLWAVAVVRFPYLRYGLLISSQPLKIAVTLLAIALFSLGCALVIAATVELGSFFSPNPEPKKKAGLVDGGIYGWIRHPMYTGLLMIIWGITLAGRTFVPTFAAACVTLFFLAKTRYEEKRLRERFPEYAAYMERTRKYLPLPATNKRA